MRADRTPYKAIETCYLDILDKKIECAPVSRLIEHGGEGFSMSTAPTYKPLEIEVTDFGPIAKAKLDLRPLTVFVGPSNTGKSYLAMLIYALHHSIGTFGYPRLGQANHYRRLFSYRFGWILRERDELSDDEVSAVLDWGTDVASRIAEKNNPADFPLRVSNSVAEIIVPMLADKDLLFSELEKEIARCFGSEGTVRLKRIGSSHNSRVMLVRRMSDDTGASDLLKYDFTINGEGRIYAASIPDNIPLSIEKDYASLWDWEDLTEPVSSIGLPRIYESSERKRRAIAVLSNIIEVVASSIVKSAESHGTLPSRRSRRRDASAPRSRGFFDPTFVPRGSPAWRTFTDTLRRAR